jgi:hypothetical protein
MLLYPFCYKSLKTATAQNFQQPLLFEYNYSRSFFLQALAQQEIGTVVLKINIGESNKELIFLSTTHLRTRNKIKRKAIQ